MAADLVEALALIAAYPYRCDLLGGHSAEELEEELRHDHPDHPAARTELLSLLGVVPPAVEEAVTRLCRAGDRPCLWIRL
ncbi:hypothetical protein ACSDR0_09500 [Streptosporangium sp. G11]|uniref:hypothetical protein n=1 Tax=Streptosporangium sp. G11 TaxID=3436926 RepID=UPI003EBD050F